LIAGLCCCCCLFFVPPCVSVLVLIFIVLLLVGKREFPCITEWEASVCFLLFRLILFSPRYG
jgi:hypothetical protein